jgi:phenylpropionate dioxygenase-like ring-hydroxylating dioxygenase large terminal subunit
MLSIEDNDLLTRTGPTTDMGTLFRRFWLPALLSSQLREPDGVPIELTLLSERLVAFRDTSGAVGIMDVRCAHRHANLKWGRNEECGLRCVYHGWKFDRTGQCTDQPAEPENSRFKDSVRVKAYLVHEVGGIVWIYMGPPELVPEFPQLEWTLLPEDHFLATKRMQFCNYLQNLEGEIDTAHVNFLHRNLRDPEDDAIPVELLPPDLNDDGLMAPGFLARKRFDLAETNFGFVAMAKSEFPSGDYYWRMTPFLVPSFTLIPSAYEAANTWTGVVPVDDHNCVGFTATWHHERPLNEHERLTVTSGAGVHALVDPETFIPIANKDNDYLIDRELQRTDSFTGIFGVRGEDLPMQEDQDGTITQRHEEHLGVTDRAIIGMRRLLLGLVKDLARGIEPPQAKCPTAYRARSVVAIAPKEEDPVELFAKGQPSTFVRASVQPAR